jgi:hypothetical protein
MNYRRGLQRVYAVLTVGWIAVVLFALPAYRQRFWASGFVLRYVPLTPEQFRAALDAGFTPDQIIEYEQMRKAATIPKASFSESRIGKAAWLAGVLFLPPISGYVIACFIIPWIYRGFRPASTA